MAEKASTKPKRWAKVKEYFRGIRAEVKKSSLADEKRNIPLHGSRAGYVRAVCFFLLDSGHGFPEIAGSCA